MAKPPEPLDEILPSAALIIEGVVAQVLSIGPQPAQPQRPVTSSGGATSTGELSPAQTLVIEVMRVLRGADPGKTITVEKPPAGYSLLAGNKGPFLLDTTASPARILGRYGPDTWRLDKIEAALKR